MTDAGEQLVRIAGRRLRVTNLDKVMYPETGTTKGEVIDYYTRIAPQLIPHVSGRAVTRKRWVEGVGTAEHPGSVFFAKALEGGAPSWVRRLPIAHSGGPKEYPLVEDVPTLVYLAQVASLELHVPQWRFTPDGGRGFADRLVLDLDPGPGVGLIECAVVAGWAREILLDMGMDPVPVTSGSKGIHLYAALPAGQTSEQSSGLALELARAIEADHADLVVSRMKKAERGGRVLIDWSQNNGAKTTIAPYSLRGRLRPTVAAPRTWEELADADLRQLMFDEVLERASLIGDPMASLGFHAGGREADAGPLSAYIAKRTAGRTPEPVPSNPLGATTPAQERPIFVIQEHHASRLHWDFRLEHDGVLVSWAVPKGVPITTERNNLAVMTEDHPMEYASFEGTIPRGEYGAGTVTIWDAGRFDLEKWRDDEVIVTLDGRLGGPLGRARFVLIRTDGVGEKSTWLMHRMKADAAGAPPYDSTLVRGTAGAPDSSGSAQDDNAQPGPMPQLARISPMLATGSTPGIARAAFGTNPPWVEIKWDGIRAIGVWNGSRLKLYARSGTDITERYPELTGADPGFGPDPALVDGEIVALDPRGRPSFSRLQNRMHLVKLREIERETPRTPVKYYLFDALRGAGRDASTEPLAARRALLEQIAAHAISDIVLPPVFDDLDTALTVSRDFGLEGVVVKDPASRYRAGTRSESWLKVKHTRTQEVVVGAIRPGRGGRTGSIGSLLLGVQGPDGLEYVGRVGSGFSDTTLSRLEQVLVPLRTDESPFVAVPAADASDALWVTPDVVAEVEFAEWTPGGTLRHARWRGLRPDKSPAEAVREQ